MQYETITLITTNLFLGPYFFSYFFKWYRETNLPTSSFLHQYSQDDIELLTQILYQNFASPPYGEKSLSYFMSSNGNFRQSLLYYIHHLFLSLQYSRKKSYGTFLPLKNMFGSLKKIIIIWGNYDKWYQFNQNQNQNRPENQTLNENIQTLNHSPKDEEYMNGIKRNATEEFLEYFQFNGIETELHEVENVTLILFTIYLNFLIHIFFICYKSFFFFSNI